MKTAKIIRTYIFNNQEYQLLINKKAQKNIYFRYNNGTFFVSAPYYVSDKKIIKYLDNYASKLLNKAKSNSSKFYDFKENYVYVFGERRDIPSEIKSDEDLQKYLKKTLCDYLYLKTREYEQLMEIAVPYKIRIKAMKSRYGSNSRKTHSISYQSNLIHYDKEIINSIIVHELCHDRYFDHSNNFYQMVLKYCPNYFALTKKLKKGAI